MKKFLLALAIMVPMILAGCREGQKDKRESLSDIAIRVVKACSPDPNSITISNVDTIYSANNDSISIVRLILRGQNAFGGLSMQTLEMAILQENDSTEFYYINECVEQNGSIKDRFSKAYDRFRSYEFGYGETASFDIMIQKILPKYGMTKEYVNQHSINP